MANPDAPEGGVITSIATTITIGSNPASSISNTTEPCAISHSVMQQSSPGLVSVGDNNTFRPIMAPNQSPSLTNRQHITKPIDLSERGFVRHVDRYTSLPRPGGVSHMPRPSSRCIFNNLNEGWFLKRFRVDNEYVNFTNFSFY